ncbi:ferrous iron transporter B, partial [Escherichia coli]
IKDLAIGLWQRAWVFLRRAGTIIFTVTVVLWLLLTFPRAAPGESQVEASAAGQLSKGLAVIVEPIGFNREIALAIIPAMA